MSARERSIAGRLIRPTREFLQTETGSSVLLLIATIAALAWANSPWSQSYTDLWHAELQIGTGSWGIREDLQHWVNNALMTVFFFVIGLEIKREIVVGELREIRTAALPVLGAVGGMVVPAVVFLALVGGGEAADGWGIAMATDIAFAVGVLALLGSQVPGTLKVFLLTLAIVDDVGAIAVIAIFYSGGIGFGWLGAAVLALGGVVGLRRLGMSSPYAYLPVGVAAWYCTYKAGIHPTIAGVALGALTPARPFKGRRILERLEHKLHPWSSFVVLPIFALANAGVELGDGALQAAASSRLAWAIVAGLVIGKTVGISAFTLGARAAKVGPLPRAVNPGHVVGAGMLGGIGFTVALFITDLAFDNELLKAEAKIGILVGSLIAGVVGAIVLAALKDPSAQDRDLPEEEGVEMD